MIVMILLHNNVDNDN